MKGKAPAQRREEEFIGPEGVATRLAEVLDRLTTPRPNPRSRHRREAVLSPPTIEPHLSSTDGVEPGAGPSSATVSPVVHRRCPSTPKIVRFASPIINASSSLVEDASNETDSGEDESDSSIECIPLSKLKIQPTATRSTPSTPTRTSTTPAASSSCARPRLTPVFVQPIHSPPVVRASPTPLPTLANPPPTPSFIFLSSRSTPSGSTPARSRTPPSPSPSTAAIPVPNLTFPLPIPAPTPAPTNTHPHPAPTPAPAPMPALSQSAPITNPSTQTATSSNAWHGPSASGQLVPRRRVKKWYIVVYNGYCGVWDDWFDAEPHIKGRDVAHKKFTDYRECIARYRTEMAKGCMEWPGQTLNDVFMQH